MATHGDAGERGVSIGRVIGRVFAVMGDNPATVFGLAFLLGALPQLLLSITGLSMRQLVATSGPGTIHFRSLTATSIAGGLILFFLSMLLQGALVRATVSFTEERRAHLGECLATGVRAALPLLGLTILLMLAAGIGCLLLLVPGIILYLCWSVAAPALVEERIGIFAAFGRSNRLTRGARWRIFGLLLVLIVLLVLIAILMGILVLALGVTPASQVAAPSFVTMVVSAIVNTFFSAFAAVLATSLYVELRQWKEGPGAARLADVFA